jgi:hypothetical protein
MDLLAPKKRTRSSKRRARGLKDIVSRGFSGIREDKARETRGDECYAALWMRKSGSFGALGVLAVLDIVVNVADRIIVASGILSDLTD